MNQSRDGRPSRRNGPARPGQDPEVGVAPAQPQAGGGPGATAIPGRRPRTAAGPSVPATSPRKAALSMPIAQLPGQAGATCWAMAGIVPTGSSALPRVAAHQGGEQHQERRPGHAQVGDLGR
jgi:hypothetical protein